jgi:pimeloyl-ACP methyl ester carboxylesterase
MLTTAFETPCDGKRLRVAHVGSGPPIVLLHGYPDNLQIWCELAPRLADRFQVTAFEWPGMGCSDPWPGGTTPMHQADRLLALLDFWQIERASLIGMDMGGQPALVFAAKYPERIRHLIVMNSLVMWDAETSWEIRLLRQFGWNRFVLRRFPRLVFRRAERTFLPLGVKLPPPLRADLWDSFRQPAVRKFVVRLCAGYQGTLPRLPELYGRISCPTLILWAGQDKHFPRVHAERLHATIPHSRLEIVPGAEHWMAWHMPDEIARTIGAFLEGERDFRGSA